jgi:hypothetical protein
MTPQYSIACEANGDLVAYRNRVEIFRGKEYLWYYLIFCMNEGNMHKSQTLTYEKGYDEAIGHILSEVELTKEQEDHIEEIREDKSNNLYKYETDYSNFD